MSIRKDLDIDQGTTWHYVVTWVDENGTPVPLTGYSIKMQIRPTYNSNTVLLELSTENGRIAITGDGEFHLVVHPAETRHHSWTVGVYDLQAVSADGTTTRLLEGDLRLHREVTR